jgi:mono/diheme cytochrome c family protein
VKQSARQWPSGWIGLGLAIGVGLATLTFWRPPSSGNPVVIGNTAVPPVPTLDSEQVARGATLYSQNCASCHGANLEGAPDWKQLLPDGSWPPPPHDGSGHTWHHSDAFLLNVVTIGGNATYNDPTINSKMPGFGDKLRAEDVAAILEFIKSKWGKEEREYQWWITKTKNSP